MYIYVYIYICTAMRGPRFSSEYTHMEIHKGKKKEKLEVKYHISTPLFDVGCVEETRQLSTTKKQVPT